MAGAYVAVIRTTSRCIRPTAPRRSCCDPDRRCGGCGPRRHPAPIRCERATPKRPPSMPSTRLGARPAPREPAPRSAPIGGPPRSRMTVDRRYGLRTLRCAALSRPGRSRRAGRSRTPRPGRPGRIDRLRRERCLGLGCIAGVFPLWLAPLRSAPGLSCTMTPRRADPHGGGGRVVVMNGGTRGSNPGGAARRRLRAAEEASPWTR